METPIIDIHIHLYRNSEQGHRYKEIYEIWEYGKKNVTLSPYGGSPVDALEAIKEAGAERAVVVNLCYRSSLIREGEAELPTGLSESEKRAAIEGIIASLDQRLRASNEWVCGLARRHRELESFVCVDPSILSPSEMEAHVREMTTDWGAKGVKVHPVSQGLYMHDERMAPVWRTCIELDLPVIAHSGPARGEHQYATPEAFAPVIRVFPKLRLVLAHMGGGAWRQLPDFAEAHPDVLYDICEIIEWTGAPMAPTDLELAKLILKVGPEKVMMGSDFPWYDIHRTVERVRELPLLTNDQKELILGANAVEFLGA
jgi:predicted TIM-barrel fold metal-dependent hydrolase